jgi:predicted transcriptional regulator
VSQYVHEKRGAEVDFTIPMQKTIADSAKRITDKSTFIQETQQLLRKAWHEKVICGVCHTQNGDAIPKGCAVCFE